MTVQTQSNKTIVLGDNVTTVFGFGFIGVAAGFIEVIFTDASGNETVLTQGSGSSQYQISLNAPVTGAIWGVGGTVTYAPSSTPIAAGTSLTIFRTLPLTQAISLQTQNSLGALGNGTETGLDTIEMQLQQVSELFQRAIVAPIVDPSAPLPLPPIAQRANKGMAFDGSGNPIAASLPSSGIISSAMQPVVDAATLALGRTAFGLGNVAVENIGAGLADDGAGNLEVLSQLLKVATNQTVAPANHTDIYLASGALLFTLDKASTLFDGFSFTVFALTGAITLQPNASDSILGRASGVPLTVQPGSVATLYTDGAASGTWYVNLGQPAIINALDFGVTGNGSTNDAVAINTFLATATALGAIAYFPGLTYNCGGQSITVPDFSTVVCAMNAIFLRTSDPANPNAAYGVYTACMFIVGNHVRFTGAELINSTVLATSTTSNAIGTGSVTFTTQAGLPIIPAQTFLRIWSAGNPANKYEGVVTSYSGTTLVLNAAFDGGSGTHADWNIGFGAVYQAPMVLHGVTGSTIENTRWSGNWYVGGLIDGWNPSTGGSLLSSENTFRNCFADAIQNRGFYIYGNATDNVFDDCFVNGGAGITDYGFNTDPANAVGSVNAQVDNKFIGCEADGVAFQGFEFGDQCTTNTIIVCTASNISNPSSAGFLVQIANTGTPQYNTIVGCTARNIAGFGYFFVGALYSDAIGCKAISCGIGFEISPQSSNQSQYISLNDCSAISCTGAGFSVLGNSVRCDLNNIKAINNGGNGVQILSGASITVVSGRSHSNSGANLSDAGTGTVSTNLVTT